MGSQRVSNNIRAWRPSGGVRKILLFPQSWGGRDRVGTYHMALYEGAQSHRPTTRWYLHLHSRLVGYFQSKFCYKKKKPKKPENLFTPPVILQIHQQRFSMGDAHPNTDYLEFNKEANPQASLQTSASHTVGTVVGPATWGLQSPLEVLMSTSELEFALWGPLACVDSKKGPGQRSSKASGAQWCSSVTLHSYPSGTTCYVLPKFWAFSTTQLIRGSQNER